MTATAVRRPPCLPVDRDLPGAAELLTDAGATRVAGFLEERGLEPHRVEPGQAYYRPGRWLAVCFRTAAVERSSGRSLCPTVTVECRPGEPGLVWAFPDDPALPGLAVAADGDLVRRRLRPRPAGLAAEPLRYRPRRRAVVRYRLDGGSVLFAKVVTPKRGRRLLAISAALGPTELRLALPAGRVAPGALIVPSLSGAPLRDLLLKGGPVPPPDRIAALPFQLHRECSPLLTAGELTADRAACRRRLDPGAALCAARVVARLLPAAGCVAGRVAEAVLSRAEESDRAQEWIVHGDLYENQVFVDGDTLGLIDLDDLGPGDPLLDAANFSAHLRLLAASGVPAAGFIGRYRDDLRDAFLRHFDAEPADLAWREAYCLLRLASAPFRVLHPDWPRRMADRLALATEVLSARS